MDDTTTGRVAIVTGGSSGIGRAVAIGLAKEGFAVAIVGRRRQALAETAAACAPARTLVIEADIAEPRAASLVVRETLRAFGRVDLLVNNAGVAPYLPIAETSDEILDSTFQLNALAPARLIREVWPAFTAQRSGCVVNVSTLGTIDPFPNFLAYAASKSALDSMTRSVAREGRAIGVRAFAVNPGAVETPMLRGFMPVEKLPTARALSPEAVAQVVLDLASGRRSEKTGACVPLPSP